MKNHSCFISNLKHIEQLEHQLGLQHSLGGVANRPYLKWSGMRPRILRFFTQMAFTCWHDEIFWCLVFFAYTTWYELLGIILKYTLFQESISNMDDMPQTNPTVRVGQAQAGQLSFLLALSGHLRQGSQLSCHPKAYSASPTPRRETSYLLTVFAKCPEPTTMKLMPFNHRFSMTINYHPKKYTYQNLNAITRKVLDARRKSHLLTTKLNGLHLAFQIEHITSKCTLLQWCQLMTLPSTKTLKSLAL